MLRNARAIRKTSDARFVSYRSPCRIVARPRRVCSRTVRVICSTSACWQHLNFHQPSQPTSTHLTTTSPAMHVIPVIIIHLLCSCSASTSTFHNNVKANESCGMDNIPMKDRVGQTGCSADLKQALMCPPATGKWEVFRSNCVDENQKGTCALASNGRADCPTPTPIFGN